MTTVRRRAVLTGEVKRFLLDYERKGREEKPKKKYNWEIPKEWVVGDSELTNDSLPINEVDFSTFDRINSFLANSRFLGYAEYAFLSQNGLIQNIAQSMAQDCVRKWIRIFSTDEENKEKSQDKIKKIEAEFRRLKVRKTIKKAMEKTILFGGCKIYPKIEGDDNDNRLESANPLYMEQVQKGSLRYLKIIEPQHATPLAVNYVDPLNQNFYVPQKWKIMGAREVHSSRLCHFAYNDVPTLLKPMYWFNGMPLVQLCLDYIYGFESVRQNIVGIIGRYNINILKTNLMALITEDPENPDGEQEKQSILQRLQIAQALQNNYSIFAIDNDKEAPEEWQQFSMSLNGLSDILSQNAELICAVTQYPAVKLLGTAPKGFNATGDTELRIYYDLVASKQETIIEDNLRFIFELVQMNLFGEIDDDLDFEFKPLWVLSDIEKSQIQKTKCEINIAYVDSKILSPEEVRENISRDPDSGYSNLPKMEISLDDEDEPDEDIRQAA